MNRIARAIAAGVLTAGLGGMVYAAGSPAAIDWKGKDISGSEVVLSARNARPAVVLFVMPEQERTAETLKQAGAVLGGDAGAQVLVVVSGKSAPEQARKLKAGGCAWPIFADPDYELSAKLDVHVWPTAIVLDKAAHVQGHLAGLPKHFSMHLETHLALATGKIEKSEFDRRLGSPELILDDPQQMASRHLVVAQRLLEKGLPDQARAELGKALTLNPASPVTQLTMARVMLTLGEVDEAVKVLDALDAGKAPPAELNLLRGRALAMQGKMPEAQSMLERAIKLNPQPAEAWYELGRVFEKQGDSARASQAYRKAFEATEQGRKLRPAVGSSK